MIPQRLELTNFFSYRNTAVLDFEGIHLAGISGPNGAGKSSIMEAITWALFGRSRARSDDDLVNRQVADDSAAEVRFTFSLEGASYRIIRSKRPGKTMVLELQIEAGDDAWKPLSEGKLRDTQAAIEALLRMNYETFTNASFLLQGKADQFTTRTASQRKEILAELLGVTEWERYREKAAAARKEVAGQIALLEARLDESALELEEEGERQEALQTAVQQHDSIAERNELKEQLLNEALRKEEIRKQQRKNVSDMADRERRLEAALNQLQETLQNRMDARRDLEEIIDEAAQISAAYAVWQTADQEVQHSEALAKRHNEITQAMQPWRLELTRERSRLEQQLVAFMEQADRVERSRAEKTRLEDNIARAKEELADLQEENERLSKLQEVLEEAKSSLQQLQGQRRLWQQELDRLKIQSTRIDALVKEKPTARKDIDEAREIGESLSERIQIIQEQRGVLTQLQAEQQTIDAQQATLRTQMKDLKVRIEALEMTDAEGACPLCNQPLSEEHRENVLASLRAEGKYYGDTFRTNEARLKGLAVEVPSVEKTIKESLLLESQRQGQQKRLATAEARLAEIEKAESEWLSDGDKRLVELSALLADESDLKKLTDRAEQLEASRKEGKALQARLQALDRSATADQTRLAQIETLLSEWELSGKTDLVQTKQRLAEENFAAEARRELAILQQQLDEVAYDAAVHQTAVERRKAVAEAPQRFQALQRAQAALEPLQTGIEDLQDQIARQKADLAEQQRLLEEAKTQLAAMESEAVDLKALQNEVRELRELKTAAAQNVALAQQRLNVLEDVRTFLKELREQKKALAQRVQRLQLLEKSCGRNGVQALLIEHALPEIEESANLLLERLTGGEMSIKFDTQRRLKSRDALAETLDIIISDRVGERPYDNYSGGEQFRINFAIRLALSQLLANRAGARLQTLVIDEGFGSQDPLGRQRLVEAINAVQNDFECILVITHIDELREAFPTRIEVQKEINGSQITVN